MTSSESDADISSERIILNTRSTNSGKSTGVAGTPFVEGTFQYDYDYRIEHVSGPAQLFRRECFEEVGGMYRSGWGIDLVAARRG
jgi:hypothetical protein